MYDGLYELIADDVDVVVHADHPTLNREVAARLAAGERLDVISTHGKYAPSQAGWLRPLDELVDPATLARLAPKAVELCSFRGSLLCVPRNIDVRVLWWRTDLMDGAPQTWDEVEAAPVAFGFTGRESGLFGLFYELMAAAGASLFDGVGRPTLTGPAAVAAVSRLRRLAAKAPPELPSWHYDDVDDALLEGRVAMAAAWPGGYDRIRQSALAPKLAPAPYPGGRSYAGCHGWAIPRTCGDLDGAVELLDRLASLEAGRLEAAAGGIPAHVDALAEHQPVDAVDAHRLSITAATIAGSMLTYPPLVRFPEVEDAGWGAIHDALTGAIDAEGAVARMQAAAEEVLA
jgi:multiple sugar transport system substrate-binding protein